MNHPAQVAIQPARVAASQPAKSIVLSIVLAFLFGPLGMLYATIVGGLVMLSVYLMLVLITFVTFGIGWFLFLLAWPTCVLWAALAAHNHNQRAQTGHPTML